MSKNSLKSTWLNTSTIRNDLGDLGDQLIDVQNNSAKLNARNVFTHDQEMRGGKIEFTGNRNNGDYMIRANIDSVSAGRNLDILRVYSEGTKASIRVAKNNPWVLYTPNDSTRLELHYTPTAAKQAVNKEYVDGKILFTTGQRTINRNAQFRILSGINTKNIISINVYRKRTADGYWFLNHTQNLGFETFTNSNNEIFVYNQSAAVNGFTDEFRWEVAYTNK